MPNGSDSGLGALICSNVSNTGSNLDIPGPTCSDIHSDPDWSNSKANGSSSRVSGANSVISKVLESTTHILPANDSANQMLPLSPKRRADGPDSTVGILRNFSNSLLF